MFYLVSAARPAASRFRYARFLRFFFGVAAVCFRDFFGVSSSGSRGVSFCCSRSASSSRGFPGVCSRSASSPRGSSTFFR